MRLLAPRAGLALATALSVATPVPAQTPPLEYAVKANYLYKFAPFVQWPAQALPRPDSPLVICIAGGDPFGNALDHAVDGQTYEGHPIAVRRLDPAEGGAICHILYIGQPQAQTAAEILAAVAGHPVLTVTDASRGVTGGIIDFVLQDGHVRFDIDQSAARASGLVISSKLLALAISNRGAAQ